MINKLSLLTLSIIALSTTVCAQSDLIKPETLTYEPYTWVSTPPKGNPFKLSK